MTLEYYREMYLYYKRRCWRLESYLKSTQSSIQDILEDREPSNEVEEWKEDDDSRRSGYTSSTSSNAPMDLGGFEEVSSHFEPGAGSMWLEELNHPQGPLKEQKEENHESGDSGSDDRSSPSVVTTENFRKAVRDWVARVCDEVCQDPK